jgi:hypothetical protein
VGCTSEAIFKEKKGVWDLLVSGRLLSWSEGSKRYSATQGDRERFRELKGRTGSVVDDDGSSQSSLSLHSRASTYAGGYVGVGDEEFSRDMQEGIRVLE